MRKWKKNQQISEHFLFIAISLTCMYTSMLVIQLVLMHKFKPAHEFVLYQRLSVCESVGVLESNCFFVHFFPAERYKVGLCV